MIFQQSFKSSYYWIICFPVRGVRTYGTLTKTLCVYVDQTYSLGEPPDLVQPLDVWEAADIYCTHVSAHQDLSVVSSPWQTVSVSASDTHSLGRVAQLRPHWRRSDTRLSLWKAGATWKLVKHTHKKPTVRGKKWKKGWKNERTYTSWTGSRASQRICEESNTVFEKEKKSRVSPDVVWKWWEKKRQRLINGLRKNEECLWDFLPSFCSHQFRAKPASLWQTSPPPPHHLLSLTLSLLPISSRYPPPPPPLSCMAHSCLHAARAVGFTHSSAVSLSRNNPLICNYFISGHIKSAPARTLHLKILWSFI